VCDVPELISAIVLLSASAPLAEMMATFEKLGFELMELEGTHGFLISGDSGLFNSSFNIELNFSENGAAFYLDADETESIQLPVEQLDEEVHDHIDVIELEQPAEFGPLDY